MAGEFYSGQLIFMSTGQVVKKVKLHHWCCCHNLYGVECRSFTCVSGFELAARYLQFANDVLLKQCIKVYRKGWFSQWLRMYFTIMEDMEYFAGYYCNFVLKDVWNMKYMATISSENLRNSPMKQQPFCFSQAVFPLLETEISFKFSRRKFANGSFQKRSTLPSLVPRRFDWHWCCVTRAREDTRGGKGKFGAERLGENAFKMADKQVICIFVLTTILKMVSINR